MSSETIEAPASAPNREPQKPSARRWGGSTWLGIALEASGAEWTARSDRADGPDEIGHGHESTPPAEGSSPGWSSTHPSDAVLVMPATSALLRVVRLPSADPVELQGMAELQVDQFSPFPAEQLVISCETLERREGQTQLLIAAARRDDVLRNVESWLGPKSRPRRVDLDILVWWKKSVALSPTNGQDRTLHLRFSDGTLWMVGVQDGHPILFRSMSLPVEESAAVEDLIGETELALAALEQEWGARPCDMVLWDAAGDSLSLRLAEALGVSVRSARTPDDFRTSRAALMAAMSAPDASVINLALPEWDAARSQKRRLHRIFRMTAAVLLAWIVAMGGLFIAVRVRAASSQRTKVALAQAQVPATEVENMQQRLDALHRHLDEQHTALEILRETTVALPSDGRLTSFSYRKGKSIELRVEVSTQYAPEDYVKALRETGLFEQIRPGRISEKQTPSGPITEFPVSGRWGGEAP